MKSTLFILAILIATAYAGNAAAGFNLGVSVGEGFYVHGNKVHRTPFNVEILPSYQISIIKFDLGLITDLDKQIDFSLRPGIRICPPFVYVRLAAPLRLSHGFDYGFLVGVGGHFFSFWIARLFIEADTFFTREGGWDLVPVEFRLGIEFGF